MTTVEKIHQEFDTAEDRLLKEAQLIIDSIPNASKGERLESLGFTASREALKAKSNRKLLVENQKQAELIKYYKRTYPFLKFLTESELDRICKKYKLIYAPVGHYKEDVPEKNLREIENAKDLQEKDFYQKVFIYVTKPWSFAPKELKKILKKGFSVPNHYDLPSTLSDRTILFLAKEFGGYKGSYNDYTTAVSGEAVFMKDDRSGLFIAAPKSHFNLKGLKNKGLGFFSMKVFEVEDPIVFRYVRGGVQVLSKWGLEANDPDLAQENLN